MTREERLYHLDEVANLPEDQWCDTAFDWFALGVRMADKYPKWTSVDEGLPKENERVRAWSLTNNEEYLCDYHDGVFEDFYGQFNDGVITHWMPIVPPQV